MRLAPPKVRKSPCAAQQRPHDQSIRRRVLAALPARGVLDWQSTAETMCTPDQKRPFLACTGLVHVGVPVSRALSLTCRSASCVSIGRAALERVPSRARNDFQWKKSSETKPRAGNRCTNRDHTSEVCASEIARASNRRPSSRQANLTLCTRPFYCRARAQGRFRKRRVLS